MREAHVVIGANYGDEGKGLVTDAVSAQTGAAVVVRFNGGAQAGHTVVSPEGVRHVFHHFGSGTMAGAATFLSRFFVCNPILFGREKAQLAGHGFRPKVYVDPDAPVSTPYDMMINQIVEETRAAARHGSCGVGFGETVERTEKSPHRLFYKDLADTAALLRRLQAIRAQWVPARLAQLGVGAVPEIWRKRLASDDIFEAYVHETLSFLEETSPLAASGVPHLGGVVFEGAQGLLLDQDRGSFPHVTRSNTGLKNVGVLAQDMQVGYLRVIHATRAYMTRHGAGPMAHELPHAPYAGIKDETNIHNEYQGSLRFGWLDVDVLTRTLGQDKQDLPENIRAEFDVAVTCLDQLAPRHTYIMDSRACAGPADGFLNDMKERTGARRLLCSYGSGRTTLALRK